MPLDPAAPVLFDAVLFDLDGTLVSTELFWVEAARAGALRAFAELGLARELPSAEDWLSMVGLPLSQGFRNVFGDLDDAQRELVQARCVEEEERALRAGGATLMAGARELLADLSARGVRLGIASNCGRGYLETMVGGLGLSEFVSEARCLDSRGVRDKADMVADLLATFGTRSALMVGDRRGDADAAHQNGLPHVHLEGPIKPRGEEVPCEARIAALDRLAGVLGRRAAWLEAALASLGLGRPPGKGLRTLGVTGGPAAGKSLFARDLARLLAARGQPAHVVALDAWRNGEADAAAALAADPLSAGYDLDRLVRQVLAPHAAGQPVPGELLGGAPLPGEALLVLEGPYLLHPRVRILLDRVVHLEVSEASALARTAARAGADGAAEALTHLRRARLPAQRAFEEAFDPRARADLVLAGDNPLGPGPPG